MSSMNYTVGVATPINVIIKVSESKNLDIRNHTFTCSFTNVQDSMDIVTPAVTMIAGMAGVFIDTANLVDDAKTWDCLVVGVDNNANEYLAYKSTYKPRT